MKTRLDQRTVVRVLHSTVASFSMRSMMVLAQFEPTLQESLINQQNLTPVNFWGHSRKVLVA